MALTEQEDPLTIEDHTLVVAAVLDHPLHVIRNLESPKDSALAQLQALDAALRVRVFDDETKSRLRRVRDVYPTLEADRAKLSQVHLDAAERLRDEIIGKPVSEKIAIVAEMREAQAGDERLAAGLDFAEQILRDGADSIYSPDHPAAELFETRHETTGEREAGDVATSDVVGGLIGGILGGLRGAVGGAAVASIAEILTVRELPLPG